MINLASAAKKPAPSPSPQWRSFLELGFRPLYLAGCAWALLSIALWIYAPQWLFAPLGGVAWHAHEMLWGFFATIAVGFLLTASSNWTQRNPLQGLPLAILCSLWLFARIGFLIPDGTWFLLASLSELLFFAGAALALGRVIYTTRNQRNYGVPLMVLALGLVDALYLHAAWRGDHSVLMERFHLGLLCMAIIALLIARRVIPFFAMRAIPGLSIPMHTRTGLWQIGAALLAALALLTQWRHVAAIALMGAGILAIVQVMAWKPWSVRHRPLLWILYVGYSGLGIGLMAAAAYLTGLLSRTAWPAHVIGMAGFAVLVIGMVTRTALGHLGKPLQTDRSMVASYTLVIAAAVFRLFALTATPFATIALHAAAISWIAAFTLYLWRYFPMMIRPRTH